jgi:hypothetical protein
MVAVIANKGKRDDLRRRGMFVMGQKTNPDASLNSRPGAGSGNDVGHELTLNFLNRVL